MQQQEAADQDVQQWVSRVEDHVAAGEAEVVGTAVEATAMTETVEATKAMGMEAAMEVVVWDTVETPARKPEIKIEEQSEIAAEAVAAAKAEDTAVAGDAERGGTTGAQTGAQGKTYFSESFESFFSLILKALGCYRVSQVFLVGEYILFHS